MKYQPNAPNAKARMYNLNKDIDMKAKVVAMARRMEELEIKKIREVQAISETPVIHAQLVYALLIGVQSTGMLWFESLDESNQQNL